MTDEVSTERIRAGFLQDDRWLAEVRAEAVELAADEVDSDLVVALWNAAGTDGDAYQETADTVMDYLHGWAAKFRAGADCRM